MAATRHKRIFFLFTLNFSLFISALLLQIISTMKPMLCGVE